MNKTTAIAFTFSAIVLQLIFTGISFYKFLNWEASIGQLKGLISYRFEGWLFLFFVLIIITYEFISKNLLIKKVLKVLILLLLISQLINLIFFGGYCCEPPIYNTAWFTSFLVILLFIIQKLLYLIKMIIK